MRNHHRYNYSSSFSDYDDDDENDFPPASASATPSTPKLPPAGRRMIIPSPPIIKSSSTARSTTATNNFKINCTNRYRYNAIFRRIGRSDFDDHSMKRTIKVCIVVIVLLTLLTTIIMDDMKLSSIMKQQILVFGSNGGDTIGKTDAAGTAVALTVDDIARAFRPWVSAKGQQHDENSNDRNNKNEYGWCIHPARVGYDYYLNKMNQYSNPNFNGNGGGGGGVGLLFVKNYKSASSTGAGITTRIAHNVGKRLQLQQENQKQQLDNNATNVCLHQASHEYANNGGHHFYVIDNDNESEKQSSSTSLSVHDPQHVRSFPRDKSISFLWTIVRDPISRTKSGYTYFRSGKQSYNYQNVKRFASGEINSQIQYLQTISSSTSTSMQSLSSMLPLSDIQQHIQKYIINEYDFIAVMERMEESLVVLSLLLNIPIQDVIVMNSKQSNTYVLNPNGKCVYLSKFPTIVPTASSSSSSSNTTTSIATTNADTNNGVDNDELVRIEEYFKTEFTQSNYDFVLYDVVNKSLDLTIEYLGVDKVKAGLEQYHYYTKLANEHCQNETIHPCSQKTRNGDSGGGGTASTTRKQLQQSKTNCYTKDWGCGYQCIDKLFSKHK